MFFPCSARRRTSRRRPASPSRFQSSAGAVSHGSSRTRVTSGSSRRAAGARPSRRAAHSLQWTSWGSGSPPSSWPVLRHPFVTPSPPRKSDSPRTSWLRDRVSLAQYLQQFIHRDEREPRLNVADAVGDDQVAVVHHPATGVTPCVSISRPASVSIGEVFMAVAWQGSSGRLPGLEWIFAASLNRNLPETAETRERCSHDPSRSLRPLRRTEPKPGLDPQPAFPI